MRILRLRLKNFKGVDESMVLFSREGTTIVEGPNEAGKSSLVEALDLLFDSYDDSNRQQVKAVKPVHRDAGAEVEVEIESGPYTFEYFKRFHRDRATKLTVTRPRPESLTGREAHERALAILGETIDTDLWKALRVQQGQEVGQADLGGQRPLLAALDRAAGGKSGDGTEENLFEKVGAEYGTFFTDSGREKKEITQAVSSVGLAEGDLAALKTELSRLEADIDRSDSLKEEIKGAEANIIILDSAAKDSATQLETVERLQQEVVRLKSQHQAALAMHGEAKGRLRERQMLVERLRGSEAESSRHRAEMGATEPAIEEASKSLREATETLQEARLRHARDSDLRDLCRNDFDFRRDEFDLGQLRERKERINRAEVAAVEARQLLAVSKADEKLFARIRRAEEERIAAKARQEVNSPSLELTVLAPIDLQVDGEAQPYGSGEGLRRSVTENITLRVPGVLEITISPGKSAAALAREAEAVTESLRSLLAEAGLHDVGEIDLAEHNRREAQRKLAERNLVVVEALRDLTPEDFDRRLRDLQDRVAGYGKARRSEPAAAPDLDSAKAAKVGAEEGLEVSTRQLADATTQEEARRTRHDLLREKSKVASIRFTVSGEEIQRIEETLAKARAVAPDEELTKAEDEAAKAARHTADLLSVSERTLATLNPERVEESAKNARSSLSQAQRRAQQLKEESIALTARLQERGEEGLCEKIDGAESGLARQRRGCASLRRRSEAASLLFQTMLQERDKARSAYEAPFREEAEKLGRYVFGDDLSFELDADLRVVSRSVGGRTVPFDDLSIGTKEQIGLIARLACVMIVSTDNAVPMIVDDALGNTDPSRLQAMGAILSIAARHCQLIVLTCYPDRYRALGDAKIVRL